MIELETLVQNATIEGLGITPDQYDEQAHFFEMGADSLDVIEIFMAVEEELGIDEIPDDVEVTTPSELIAYLREQLLTDA